MNTKTLGIGLVAILILIVGWYWLRGTEVATEIEDAPIATATYQCDGGAMITAAYFEGPPAPATAPGQPPTPTGSAQVSLDGGATMTTLQQTISADGVRYANADESFVFWSKGDEALVMRNNAMDLGYTNCRNVSAAQGDGTDVSQNLILGLANDADHGEYLSAFNGMALYTYDADAPGVSNCTGECAAKWPPYTVPSADAINVPVNITGAVSTIERADGTLQVTYDGMPLYFYAEDRTLGDLNGADVSGWSLAGN